MKDYDLIIIGSGPGGYVSAVKAAQLGLRTLCVEKEELGGVCLNWGCIPTKAIIKSVDLINDLKDTNRYGIKVDRLSFDFSDIIRRSRIVAKKISKGVEYLFKKYGVSVEKGWGKIFDSNTVEIDSNGYSKKITGKNILIATGARPVLLPGVKISNRVLTSKEALILNELPESITIIGSGAIGTEFAYIFSSLGSKVNLIELLPQVLPAVDEDVSTELSKALKKHGVKIYTSTKVKNILENKDSVEVEISNQNGTEILKSAYALISIGVIGNTGNLGLKNLGIETEKGFIKVSKSFKTNIDNIYAIGDVIGQPALAHVASKEGLYVVEKIAGKEHALVNYRAIPYAVYTKPQVAGVGLTEKEAKDSAVDYNVGIFPFSANGKCTASGDIYGFVKVLFNKKDDTILGAHIVGHEASELVHIFIDAIENKLKYKDMKKSVFAHPTASEAIHEAILSAYNEQIHI